MGTLTPRAFLRAALLRRARAAARGALPSAGHLFPAARCLLPSVQCCPSRAEITTGRYMHNTEVYGNDCGGMDFINGPEKLNMAYLLRGMRTAAKKP